MEGLTLASFFQPKEKCLTLKCIQYNERKKVTIMPPIPVLLLVGIVLLLLFFMVCQEGCRALQTGDRGKLLKGVDLSPSLAGQEQDTTGGG